MNEEDFSRPAFWNERYEAGKMPWHTDAVPARLQAFLGSAGPGSVLIPGCGAGHGIRPFAEKGWDVLGIDFSAAAVQRAQKEAGDWGDRIALGDFFRHDFGERRFDVVYERTFLCALPLSLRTNYARRVHELLKPSGRLIGFFFYGFEEDPPPHPLAPGEEQELLGPLFDLERDEAVADSLPMFEGRERWQVWRRRSKLS